MIGHPIWSAPQLGYTGNNNRGRSQDSSSEEDDDDDEIEGYNSEDFDSEDSESNLPALLDVHRNDRPPGYQRGQITDGRNTTPSSSSSSSTLNSDVADGALTRYENAASKANPNSFIVYTCPLCMDEGKELSSLACGHVFCSTCTKRALHHKRECPICRRGARMRDVRRIFLAC
ncbi:hypothetical protein SCHPADRAFT_928881 [Schizopora paradoxa]|uniref:RING-type domain-containing protein n=1 Tax=Schizopora paradoxa TaxID=27342 RepID=A0A0H2RM21_9AGAM|nr:hypothetical protein SCHPADRAFT_928881 [Schizopora paradoxa]